MKAVFVLAAVILFTTACARSPSVTETDKWVSATAPGPVVSICYSAAESTREEVMAFALTECQEDLQALTLIGEDTALNDCPLLKRARVAFACVPPGSRGQIFP